MPKVPVIALADSLGAQLVHLLRQASSHEALASVLSSASGPYWHVVTPDMYGENKDFIASGKLEGLVLD